MKLLVNAGRMRLSNMKKKQAVSFSHNGVQYPSLEYLVVSIDTGKEKCTSPVIFLLF